MNEFSTFCGYRTHNVLSQNEYLFENILPLLEPEQVLEKSDPTGQYAFTRIIWSTHAGPAKGGVRISKQKNDAALKALAIRILLKCSTNKLPHGGAAGEIILRKENYSVEALKSIILEFLLMNKENLVSEKDILSPDLGFGASEIVIAANLAKSDGEIPIHHINGKPIELGGVAGRKDATGIGAAHVLDRVLEWAPQTISSRTYSMQGFGHAGQGLATTLDKQNWTCVSLSDSTGTLFSKRGLNIQELISFKSMGGCFETWNGDGAEFMNHEAQFDVDADLFIPAFNSDEIFETRARLVRCKLILEIANSPITEDADRILNDRGIVVIPDLIGNAGGIIASHLEWYYGAQGILPPSEESAIFEVVKSRLDVGIKAMMEMSEQRKISFPDAANIMSIEGLSV